MLCVCAMSVVMSAVNWDCVRGECVGTVCEWVRVCEWSLCVCVCVRERERERGACVGAVCKCGECVSAVCVWRLLCVHGA